MLITVDATITVLLPFAYRSGPLWGPMCYRQIGLLLLTTVITKILVPVLYVIFVLDLKILKWEDKRPAGMDEVPPEGRGDGMPAPAAAPLPAPS